MKSAYTVLLNNLLIIAVCFFVGISVGSALALWIGTYFDPDTRSYYLAQTVVQNVISFMGVAIAAAWIISKKPLQFLSMKKGCSVRALLGVVLIYAIALPALNQLILYNQQISLPASFSGVEMMMKEWEESAATVTNIILAPTDIGSLLSGILIIGCLTGLSEEMLFRGLLQHTFESYPGMKHWAIWCAAFIFSAVHMQFYGFIPRLLLGAFFGYMLFSTRSLWPAAFAHALNNSVVVLSAWIANRYPGSLDSPETWGTVTTGFPWMAACSVIILVLFLFFYYNYFFFELDNNGQKKLKN